MLILRVADADIDDHRRITSHEVGTQVKAVAVGFVRTYWLLANDAYIKPCQFRGEMQELEKVKWFRSITIDNLLSRNLIV